MSCTECMMVHGEHQLHCIHHPFNMGNYKDLAGNKQVPEMTTNMTTSHSVFKPKADALPYPVNEGKTHFDGCYRTPKHHNCAVERVDKLQSELTAANAKLERYRVALEHYAESEYEGSIAREALEEK